jgi:PadR family transcriptional regulator PadR
MEKDDGIGREFTRGAAPLAVLHLLSRRAMYGYELTRALSAQSQGVLDLGHSTLYPILYNLENKGLLRSEERTAESGRARRYYHVTPKGERRLDRQRSQWLELSRGMEALGLAGGS